jgi:hypothetical protein
MSWASARHQQEHLMASIPAGVFFTLPQLASFLAWSKDGQAGHGLLAVVRWDWGLWEEVVEVHRPGDDPLCPRWVVYREPGGTVRVVRHGRMCWAEPAASVEEAQMMIEMEDAVERRPAAWQP